MILGSMVHCLILEPSEFQKRYTYAEFDLRTKAGKEWACTVPEGMEIVNEELYQKAYRMAGAICASNSASKLISLCTEFESVVHWDVNGVQCRSKLDGIGTTTSGKTVVVDLKTTVDASPESFAKSIVNYRYHVQAAFYMDAIQADSFAFICVENTAPYNAAVYQLDADSIDIGRAEYMADLEVYKRCLQTDEWPGYDDTIQLLSLPAWYLKKV